MNRSKGSPGRRRSLPLAVESRCARVGFGDRTPQSLAVTDQGVQLSDARLGRHPATQQALKARHIQLCQQQTERGIRWGLAEIGAQQLVERLPVAFGKSLHSHQRTLAAQDRENRHQEHPPLGKANAAAHPAVRKGLEEADQITCSDLGGVSWEAKGQGRFPRTTQ